jgi:hypothetical protein
MAGGDAVYTVSPVNDTETRVALVKADDAHNVLVYVLLPIGSVVLVGVIIVSVSICAEIASLYVAAY